MAGKADGPADVDRSTEHRGSSAATPGLTALDEEREASLADEGGASGGRDREPGPRHAARAWLPTCRARTCSPPRPAGAGPGFWFVAGALAAGAIGALAAAGKRAADVRATARRAPSIDFRP